MNPTHEQALALFREQRLPFPPIAPMFAQALKRRREGLYSTCSIEDGVYAMNPLVEREMSRSEGAWYAIVGFDGYGAASHAVHYVSVTPSLALFVQRPWGGMSRRKDMQRAEIEDAFNLSRTVQEIVGRAEELRRIGEDEQLVLVTSTFDGSRWAWRRWGEPVSWRTEPTAVVDACREIAGRIR